MGEIEEKIKKLGFDSPEKEVYDALNQLLRDYDFKIPEAGIEKIKLIYQIREIRNQANIKRKLVCATWVLVAATWALGIIQLICR